MNKLLAVLLCLSALPLGAATTAPYRSPEGLFQCDVPRGAEGPSVVQGYGTLSVEFALDLMSGVTVDYHPMTLRERFAGKPPALAYAESLQNEGGAAATTVVSPLKQIEVAGLPAWTLVRDYRIERPERAGGGKLDTRDVHVVIQRKASFLVLRYASRPSFFADRYPEFQRVLASLQLLPEPFLRTPAGLLTLAAAVALFLAMALILILNARASSQLK